MNSELKNRVFQLDRKVIDFLDDQPEIEGLKRNKNLLEKGTVTYGQLKRILHDLKKINKLAEPQKYNYYGGDVMLNWGMNLLRNERSLIHNREESQRIANDIAGLSGERRNPSLKRHSKNTFSPKITLNNIVKPTSNSEKFSNSSMFSAKSMKLFESREQSETLLEEIKRIKELML